MFQKNRNLTPPTWILELQRVKRFDLSSPHLRKIQIDDYIRKQNVGGFESEATPSRMDTTMDGFVSPFYSQRKPSAFHQETLLLYS